MLRYFDQKTETETVAGTRREHRRGRPRQSTSRHKQGEHVEQTPHRMVGLISI